MRHRVLIVDDEQAMLNLFSSVLKDRYAVNTAASAEEALQLLRTEAGFSVVLADIFLPGMSGLELLAQCARLSPESVRIALTGDPGRDTVVESVNYANVFRFVSKPVRIEVLAEIVETALQHYESLRLERDMMETTVRTSVNLLLEVLATLDPASFELSQRLRGSVRVFARTLQLPNPWELELAASLARIGTVSLPAPLLRKKARDLPLAPREAELLADVPRLGSQLLRQIPRLDRVAQAIRYQAKNYDGSGTPAGGPGRNDIPLGARILRIFTDRALLEVEGIMRDDAYDQMAARKGVYDPELLAASFQRFPDYILSAVTSDKEVRLVAPTDLKPDMVLVTEVRTTERLLLVAAGTRLTPLIVQRIQTHALLGTVVGPFGIQVPTSDVPAPLPLPDPTPVATAVAG
ncbi:MAG TPA: HD domain-containing phosphohydrolase [Opitutaceae bacterium]|nr:HD domain-containing phosphohydrolase [Opitutaceae bacterium]